MSQDTDRIETTVVGSYPIPDWLAASPTDQALVDATRTVFHTQQQAGIDLVCDGELYRFDVNHPETNGMIDYFVAPMAGIRTEISFDEMIAYRAQSGMGFRRRPPGVVEGEIGSGTLDLPAACDRARDLAGAPLKFTLTGPHMLAKTLIDHHYGGDLAALTDAIARVLAEQVAHCDAEVIQVDEANLPGHPDEWRIAADSINRVLDAVKGRAAVHLCFGNYGGQTIQSGTWAALIDYLNALHADHIVMENAHRPADELAAFRDLDPRIGMGLGVIDVKRTDIESPDDVANAIERAATLIGPGRVRTVHPDCGFWMLKRPIADAKMRALVAGRDLYEGRSGTVAA
jgi:5-methyltetrahydropteroyltriglutamate--homocysteine methyltransferase